MSDYLVGRLRDARCLDGSSMIDIQALFDRFYYRKSYPELGVDLHASEFADNIKECYSVLAIHAEENPRVGVNAKSHDLEVPEGEHLVVVVGIGVLSRYATLEGSMGVVQHFCTREHLPGGKKVQQDIWHMLIDAGRTREYKVKELVPSSRASHHTMDNLLKDLGFDYTDGKRWSKML